MLNLLFEMQALSTAFTLILLSWSAAAESIHYVRHNASSSGNCPLQPCLLLDQYIQESSKYFKTESTFIFLPGKHFLKTSLNITAVSNISFRGAQDNSHSTIICSDAITATNVTSLEIKGLTFILSLDQLNGQSSSLVFISSQEVAIANSVFQNGSIYSPGRAILSTDSEVTITNCLFESNKGDNGGAIFAEQGTFIILIGNTFTRNQATERGGAIYAEESTISLTGSVMNNFSRNSGNISGGAIYSTGSTIVTRYNNIFHNNFLTGERNSTGGAIGMVAGSSFIASGYVDFINNEAILGGAFFMNNTEAEFRQCSIMFKDNVAKYLGGGMYSNYSSFTTDDRANLTFIGNTAETIGPSEVCGVMCFYVSILTNETSQINNNMSSILINNSGTGGGALFMEKTEGSITLYDIYARDNMDGAVGILYSTVKCTRTSFFEKNSNHGNGIFTITGSTVTIEGSITLDHNYASAVTAIMSTVEFKGKTIISSNFGRLGGGGINSTKSSMIFSGMTSLHNNSGHIGGGILTERGTIEFKDSRIAFSNNKATANGGGLYASSTAITMQSYSSVIFSLNSAELGGAMYLRSNTTLMFSWYSELTTTDNSATEYGGAMYHEDVVNIVQCRNVTDIIRNTQEGIASIPYSFLQFDQSLTNPRNACPRINSHNDSAGKDGDYLYGGLLDRSRLQDTGFLSNKYLVPYDYFTSSRCKLIFPVSDEHNAITSQPFQLINCDDDDIHFQNNITVYRGQTFKLQIVALGQGKSNVTATLTALISLNARLKLNQSSQYISRSCSEVTYNLYSTKKYETLTIFPQGPCQTIGQASTFLNVTFRPCPDAFNQSNEECVCEDRLKYYNATCVIEDGVSILRNEGINFWMQALYINHSYSGLILYPSCPAEYCTADTVNISLEDPDVQCASNRGGVLCGWCTNGSSLWLGGSRCDVCSNFYLLLILPFALAGIALIIFLSFLRLTVASGTINSLILYANIVQANRRAFFPSNRADVLTVFIAWLNLDFGFEICFFDKMDIYVQTWLQFVFSIYVWMLISMIILSSRYSITVSKWLGYNPVAVLATLLLMSYNKILKVIIDVFSSVDLEYPDDKKVTVWLKDGNLPYLHSKHLLLSIFTLLVLVFIFLPYTIFLLLGYLLYRLRSRKWYRWLLIRIKPLLDSYYAPYKANTRYWTGSLLIVRCVLYIVFSFNSLSGTTYSLLSINIVFAVVGSMTWLIKGIYRFYYIDVIEVSVYMNLIALSAAAGMLPESSKEIASYVLVGIFFATAMGIFTYHIHLTYIAKSALWLKIKSRIPRYWWDKENPAADLNKVVPCKPEPIKAVTQTHIQVQLREPLLES